MASEIRVNQIQSRTGVSTVSFTDSGPIFAGISTVQGPLTVDEGVTGNVTGNVTGDVTGNVTGDITSSGTSTFDVISGVSTIGVTTVHLTGINDLNYPTAGPLSNRNMVDNGAMVLAQRGTSAIVVDSPDYIVDRWSYRRTGTNSPNRFTMSQRTSGAPDGFTHYLRLAQGPGGIAAQQDDSSAELNTVLEGFNFSQAGFGTSAAKDITLSFYARVSEADTYCVTVHNSGEAHTYIAEVDLTTSWARYEITIPARTSGTWNTDETTGVSIRFIVSADNTAFPSASTGWNTDGYRYTSNQSEAVATTPDATFDVTGVQLEIGSKATPFEHRNYVDELARCQRYYETGNWHGMYKSSDDTMGWVNYKVTKRANPSVTSIAPGGTTTNRIYYYSVATADRGERSVDINNTAWTGGMTDFTNSFFGILGNFTPSQTNDATFHGIYRADADF